MHFLDVQRFNNAAKTLKPEVIKKKCGQVTDNWGARRSLKRVSSFIQAEIRSSNEVTHQQTGYVHLWTLILRAGQRRHWWLHPAASFAQHIRKQHQEWTSSAACPCPVTKQEIQTNQKQAYASTHIWVWHTCRSFIASSVKSSKHCLLALNLSRSWTASFTSDA